MTIGFIPPILTVLEDQSVSTQELNWLMQELVVIAIISVMSVVLWKMVDKGFGVAAGERKVRK